MSADASKTCTIRTKKFLVNRLLGRRQMDLEIIHAGRPNVPRKELQAALAKQFKAQDANQVSVFGIRTKFGGGQSTAFALVYDNMTVAKKFEPKYRLVRVSSLPMIVGVCPSLPSCGGFVAVSLTLFWHPHR
jgi:small subunit ribosomal protein S24e